MRDTSTTAFTRARGPRQDAEVSATGDAAAGVGPEASGDASSVAATTAWRDMVGLNPPARTWLHEIKTTAVIVASHACPALRTVNRQDGRRASW